MDLFQLVGKIAIDNEKANREIDQTTEKAGGSERSISKSFKSVGEGAMNMSKKFGAAGAAVGGAVLGLAEGTRDYRTEMGKLETGFTTSGHSANAATKTYQGLYAVLGESDTSVEAANHLAKLCDNEEELNTWTDICTGVFATFGDSLPIEGLTEAANETAKVGQVTGPLADALNWVGISEDEFNEKLAACSSEQERQALITKTLNGAYSEAAQKYREVNGDVMEANEAQAKFTDSMAKLGEIVEPVVTKIKTAIAKAVSVLAGMPEGMQKAIIAIGLFVVAAGPLLAGFGMIATGIGSVISVFGKLGSAIKAVRTAFGVLRTALMANPFTLIIAGIAALVAGFVYLWNHCEGFREFWINLWETVKAVAIAVWNAIRDFFTGIWDGIKLAAETIWGGIAAFFTGLWDGMKTAVETVWNGISSFLSAIWDGIKTVAAATWNAIKQAITAALEGIKTAVSAAWNAIKAAITAALDAIKSIVTVGWNAIKSAVAAALGAIKSAVTTAWNAIKSAVTVAVNAVKSTVTTAWNAIKSAVITAMNAIKSAVTTAWNAIKSVVTTVLGGIRNAVSTVWNGVKSVITGVLNAVKNAVSSAWGGIRNTTSTVFNGIKSIASKAWNGIKTAITKPIEKARDVIKKIIDTIKGFFSKFKISLPKIKLPHFSIKPKGWNIGDLLKGSVPKLGIEWYAKGGVLNQPAIFGVNPVTGAAMAGGEAGAEAVAPVETLMGFIRAAVQEENAERTEILERMLGVLQAILDKDTTICIDGKPLIKVLDKGMGGMY